MRWSDDRFGTLRGREAGERRPWPLALAIRAVCALLAAISGAPSR